MILSHITINTAKLDDSVAFYENIIGLHIVRDMRGNKGPNIVFLSDERADFCIELVENSDHSFEGKGISIGFATQDLDKEAAVLKEKGITPRPVISPNPHTRFFFISDPNGVQIQFIEEK